MVMMVMMVMVMMVIAIGEGEHVYNNFEFQGVLDVFRVFKLARILKLARY